MATQTISVQDINQTAREIWLAGLGAAAKVQAEGAKIFENLVKEGEVVEKKTRDFADAKVSAVRGKVEKQLDDVKKTANSRWDKLEDVFEKRVAKVLNNMGVPTRDDIEQLSEQIAELSKAVKELSETRKKAAK